jgi:regulator of RNase E activity RraB
MSKDWERYACEIDGRPATVFLDMAIAEDAPLDRLPVAAWLQLRLQHPRGDGLAGDDELAALDAIEHALVAGLTDKSTVYVGSITTNGRRDFHFYTAAAAGWKERVSAALRACPAYAFTCGSRPDREWDIYFDRLSPSDEDLVRIQNRRLCDALQRSGERFEQLRPIEHSAYFPDAARRARFIDRATQLGCRVVELLEPEARGEQFGVRVSAIGIPSHAHIDELVLPLVQAAEDCDGEYDGWETQVID